MKVCLVNAPTAAEFGGGIEIESDVVRQITLEPQLGILSLAAVLEARGDSPEIVDLNRTYFHLADSAGVSRLTSQRLLPPSLLRKMLKCSDLLPSAAAIR